MKVALVVHDYNANFGQGRYCIELVKRLHNRVKFLIFANTFDAPIYLKNFGFMSQLFDLMLSQLFSALFGRQRRE